MRGRVQASVVALIGSWFPLISPAAVALVTLRRGANDGTLVLLVAMLPALAALYVSDMGPLMALITLISLLLVFAVSLILRRSMAWLPAIMGLVALSSASSLLLGQVVPDPIGDLQEVMGNLLKEMQAQSPDQQALPELGSSFVLGLIAYVLALSSIASLLLARWWQSLLYNPGGFQQEFHWLKLNKTSIVICLASVAYCLSRGGDYAIWASLFGFPLLLLGIAVMHNIVGQRQMGKQWLVLMYVALLLTTGMIGLALTVLAVVDSWFDLRGRLSKPKA